MPDNLLPGILHLYLHKQVILKQDFYKLNTTRIQRRCQRYNPICVLSVPMDLYTFCNILRDKLYNYKQLFDLDGCFCIHFLAFTHFLICIGQKGQKWAFKRLPCHHTKVWPAGNLYCQDHGKQKKAGKARIQAFHRSLFYILNHSPIYSVTTSSGYTSFLNPLNTGWRSACFVFGIYSTMHT